MKISLQMDYISWYDEWITLIKWNSSFEPKVPVIYCFFFVIVEILQK